MRTSLYWVRVQFRDSSPIQDRINQRQRAHTPGWIRRWLNQWNHSEHWDPQIQKDPRAQNQRITLVKSTPGKDLGLSTWIQSEVPPGITHSIWETSPPFNSVTTHRSRNAMTTVINPLSYPLKLVRQGLNQYRRGDTEQLSTSMIPLLRSLRWSKPQRKEDTMRQGWLTMIQLSKSHWRPRHPVWREGSSRVNLSII